MSSAPNAPNEIDNPFPRPPERFKLFTPRNVGLLKTLRERTGTNVLEPLPQDRTQAEILEGENLDGVPEDLTELEPPRVDWIVEGGRYEVFGVWTEVRSICGAAFLFVLEDDG